MAASSFRHSTPFLREGQCFSGAGPRKRPLLLAATIGFFSLWFTALFAQTASDFRPPVSYRLEARLNAKDGLIKGVAYINWSNVSPDPVTRLQFHLYMNAFESENTTFFREERRETGKCRFDPAHPGKITVQRLEAEEMGDLTAGLRFIQPDDGNPDDRTVAEVALPKAVEPGKPLRLKVLFETRLPAIYARSGRQGDFFMAGQWYPKLGVLEPPGWRHAGTTRWNCRQYHFHSEYYANFANYEVRLTVPASFKVGATGREVMRKQGQSSKETVYLFRQDAVVDFAWSASPDFIEVDDRFSGQEDVTPEEYAQWAGILGVSPESLRLPTASLRLLVQRDHASAIPLFKKTLKNAIKMYGLLLGPYPYGVVTMIDPPAGAEEAGGMEYPTLFTNAYHRLAGWWPLSRLKMETAITHEFGHNYWMGLAASDESDEPWIDEGINSYCENRLNAFLEGKGDCPLEGFGLGSFSAERMFYLISGPYRDALASASWRFEPGAYYSNTYARPALTLLTLEGIMGRDAFLRSLRGFFQAYKFKHPDTQDFLTYFSASGGEAVRRFLSQAFAAGAWVDYRVESLNTREDSGRKEWVSDIVAVRDGTISLPVNVRLRFADNRTRLLHWDGVSQWTRFTVRESSPVVSAEVDPALSVALDRCFANNSKTSQPATGNVSKLQALFQFLIQVILYLLTCLV